MGKNSCDTMYPALLSHVVGGRIIVRIRNSSRGDDVTSLSPEPEGNGFTLDAAASSLCLIAAAGTLLVLKSVTADTEVDAHDEMCGNSKIKTQLNQSSSSSVAIGWKYKQFMLYYPSKVSYKVSCRLHLSDYLWNH